MFKKKPQIKNLAPLRSSDRRRLADQIISDFQVHVPQTVTQEQPTENGDATPTIPTLTSIRASLLPEDCQSARFTTHAGPDLKLVSGTIYVGAHQGQEERILWLSMGQRQERLYPTVYTLWHNPGLVPLLHAQGLVIQKLKTGADLMTPGLVGGPPWPARAIKNAVVAVASIERPSVPAWVGVCEVDVSSLGSVQGLKGPAVKGVHWESDEIWAWSSSNSGGRGAPESIEGWFQEAPAVDAATAMEGLDLDDDDGQEDGGVALEEPQDEQQQGDASDILDQRPVGERDEQDPEPTTKEIDQAFHDAFLYAVYSARTNGEPPHHGFAFPIQPSFVISNMVQPHLRSQSPQYTMKKTSWKNTKKFIKFLDKAGLIKSKDRSGGETVIVDIDFDDSQVRNFVPYKLPKTPSDVRTTGETDGAPQPALGSNDPSHNQSLTLQMLFRPSAKLVPDLIPSKTAFYTSHQISQYLRTYVESHPELTSASSSRRMVKLDPFIANNILGSNSTAADSKALAAGEIARDQLQKRLVEDHNLCVPYWVLLRNAQKWDPDDSSLPKPKSGAPPKVGITIEKRSGTKVVTKIANVEVFGINPSLLGPELQKKCASSTSVGQLVGGKPGVMEILVQGDQRDAVEKELARRGVDRRWIEISDKTKKKTGAPGAGGRR